MPDFIPVNIRMFEGDEEVDMDTQDYFSDGEFDVERFRQDFEKSHSTTDEVEDEQTEEDEEESSETTSDEEETEETEEKDTADDEEKDEDEDEDEEKTDSSSSEDQQSGDKQNQAFAKMRNELKQEKELGDFVRQLADQQGLKPEELMQAYQQKKLEAEAKEKGVPVDVMQRINQLEQENQQSKLAQIETKFNTEVAQVQEKHELDDNQLQGVFDYMAQNGYVGENSEPLINFEDAYILANKDSLIDQAKDQGRQEYLKEKKKKQQKSTVNTGQSTSSGDGDPGDFSKEDIAKQFEKMNLGNPFET